MSDIRWDETDDGPDMEIANLEVAKNPLPAGNLQHLPFPECASKCATVEYLGAGECDFVCPFKFDKDGHSLEVKP